MMVIRAIALGGMLATSRPGLFFGAWLVCELLHIIAGLLGLARSDN